MRFFRRLIPWLHFLAKSVMFFSLARWICSECFLLSANGQS